MLRPASSAASCSRQRPHPASIFPPVPSPRFRVRIWKGSGGLSAQSRFRDEGAVPSFPKPLDSAADPCIEEECGSGRGVRRRPIGAGSWGHVGILLASYQILNPGAEEFAGVTSEIFRVRGFDRALTPPSLSSVFRSYVLDLFLTLLPSRLATFIHLYSQPAFIDRYIRL